MKVAIRYFIIFEPSEAWQSQGEFADGLESYFRSNGYSLEYVETKNADEVIISLEKASDPVVPQVFKVATLKQQIAQQTTKRGFDGKFKKGDGS